MDRISFLDSELCEIIKRSLMAFYRLVESGELNKDTLEGILEVYKNEDVIYMSKWLSQKGFSLLEELSCYEYEVNFDYCRYLEIRNLILELDLEIKDPETAFISITELLNTSVIFSKENGINKKLNC